MATTSNKAFKIDHEDSMRAVLTVATHANVTSDRKLAYLLGARMALIQGGVPESHLMELNGAIDYLEKNRTLHTPTVQENVIGEEKRYEQENADDSGS